MFAQDNKSVEWGEEAFFKKTWPEAVLFCMEKNQILPNSDEANKLDKPTNYWEVDSNYYLKYTRKAKCVKKTDNNKTQVLNIASDILKACRNQETNLKESAKQEENKEDNRTIGNKLADLGSGVVNVGSKVLLASASVGVAVISRGQVGSGDYLSDAFNFNASDGYPALNADVCLEIYNQAKRIEGQK